MSILNYIKGDSRGSRSRDIEKRSLTDPFLSDALDGYENRPGDGAEHIRCLGELGRDIGSRRIPDRKNRAVLIYMAILLLLVCVVIFLIVKP